MEIVGSGPSPCVHIRIKFDRPGGHLSRTASAVEEMSASAARTPGGDSLKPLNPSKGLSTSFACGVFGGLTVLHTLAGMNQSSLVRRILLSTPGSGSDTAFDHGASALLGRTRAPTPLAFASASVSPFTVGKTASSSSPTRTSHPAHSEEASAATTTAYRSVDDSFDSSENLIAGALSGLIAETLMHAFDTVSHRAKVHPSSAYGNFSGAFQLIWRQEGIRGYFAGVSATIAQAPPANATYFFCYEALKSLGLRMTDHDPTTESAVYFLSGALSEVASSVLFVPLEVAKARMQLGSNPHRATGGVVPHHTNFPHLHRALSGIYRESGFRGLTAGWQAGLALDAAFSGTQFALYEQCKKLFRRIRRREQLTTGETLLAGGVSGGIAAALTNPLDCITSRIQSQVHGTAGYGTSFASVFKNTVAEGPVALWRGTLPRVMQVAPLSAISFGVYEAGRRYLKDTALFRDSRDAAERGNKYGDS